MAHPILEPLANQIEPRLGDNLLQTIKKWCHQLITPPRFRCTPAASRLRHGLSAEALCKTDGPRDKGKMSPQARYVASRFKAPL